MLYIKGATVVCDAGVGRRSFLEMVLEEGANYICPIKGNSKIPFEKVKEEFSKYSDKNSRSRKIETIEESKKIHGRIEKRYCTIIRKENYTGSLFSRDGKKDYYPEVNVIGKIVYEIEEKETRPLIQKGIARNKVSKYEIPKNEVRYRRHEKYFITNLDDTIDEIFRKIRLQWSIENHLHWALDTALGEDANRTRNKLIAQNLSLIRKVALNQARQDKTKKMGLKAKLKLAGWDEEYLEYLLFQTKIG